MGDELAQWTSPRRGAQCRAMIWDALAGFGLIFVLRLGDVPIGTLRTMLMIQGKKAAVFGLAILECLIWVLAISRVLSPQTLNDPFRIAGYVLGFATGVIVGMTIEDWVAVGTLLVRIISRTHSEPIRQSLLDNDFGVTAVDGRGREGPVMVLFVVCPRRRLRELLKTIEAIDPNCVVTFDTVTPALGHFHGAKERQLARAESQQK
ncbi:DUF2179 domain-containing protein [Fontivita pretiosa]|jgi:uncharacterized protein YebE (UPF0316 family)|uniref:DUF2179 domain-containing protein n=1 Tax=Fontivita pretiosa TaxID=2989684 RepID=UPI003D173739